MGAQLTPIFPSDLVSPGVIYFARLDPLRPADIKAWWIVLRCSEDVLPQSFLESKDPQARAFPFWVIGKPQFVWLSRDALYLLHPSQKSAFERPGFPNTFAKYYALATGPAKGNALSFFRQELANARVHHSAGVGGRAVEAQEQQRGRSTDSYHPTDDSLFIAEDEGAEGLDNSSSGERTKRGRRKRQKTSQQSEVSHSTAMTVPPASNGQPQRAESDVEEVIEIRNINRVMDSPRVKIKTEAEEKQYRYANGIQTVDRVRIFIGTRQFRTSRRAIEKSPVLTSYIQRDEMGMFIMHPRLNQTEVEDFLSILDFMQRGDISPRMVSNGESYNRLTRESSRLGGHENWNGTNMDISRNGNTPNNSSTPSALQGLRTSAEYSNELVRAGRLYLLGKAFSIANLNAYLINRITTTEYRPYSIEAIITTARIIFSASGTHRAGYFSHTRAPAQTPTPTFSPTTPTTTTAAITTAAATTSSPSLPFPNNDNNNLEKEPMEQWIIHALADNFKDIMQNDRDRSLFWDMERETAARKLVAEVYSCCADKYRALGGIPVRID